MPKSSSEGAATAVARLTTDAQSASRILDVLAECLDSDAVAVSSAEESDGSWSVALHFREQPNEGAVRALIARALGGASAPALQFETLAPTDWVRESRLPPAEAGRFVVHGAHDRAQVPVNRIAIEIEAGLAFGTGHHDSTRGCLLALDRIAKRWRKQVPSRPCNPGRGRAASILDVGTGSGVLAIAAAKALHCPIIGTDIDRRAVTTARDNMRHNGVGCWTKVLQANGVRPNLSLRAAPFDLVLANILLEPLKQLATPIAALTTCNGLVVLSGLLNAQVAPAIASYRACGFVLVQRLALAGWSTLVLAHRPSRRRARRRAVARISLFAKSGEIFPD
jgi:ribosomal protein L11 methyltransferase